MGIRYLAKNSRRQELLRALKNTVDSLDKKSQVNLLNPKEFTRRLAGGGDCCGSCGPVPCCPSPGIVVGCTTGQCATTPCPQPCAPCCNPCTPPRVRRIKSRELRAGTLIVGCECEKKNGIQDQCPRYDCSLMGNNECLPRPSRCGPSKFASAKHLGRKDNPDRENHVCYPAFVQKPFECSPCCPGGCTSCP